MKKQLPQLPNPDEVVWQSVPSEVRRLVKAAAGPSRVINLISPDLPSHLSTSVWYNPDANSALFHTPDAEKAAEWVDALAAVPFVDNVIQVPEPIQPGANNEPWLLVKRAVKVSDVGSPLAVLAGHKPGLWPWAPNTLSATLGSGLLGAGAGYGLGWLGEHLLPSDHFQKGRLRRTAAVLGALGLGGPSLWYGLRGGYQQDPPGTPPPDLSEPQGPPPEAKAASVREAKLSLFEALDTDERHLDAHYQQAIDKLFTKQSDISPLYGPGEPQLQGGAGAMFVPYIPTDQFNKVVWNDPFTPPAIRAATSGLVEAASLSRGGVNTISPLDIVHIGLGAGSGYYSSQLVGKTLGALAGLKPESQQQLQRMGVWAGILSNVVPLVLGGR